MHEVGSTLNTRGRTEKTRCTLVGPPYILKQCLLHFLDLTVQKNFGRSTFFILLIRTLKIAFIVSSHHFIKEYFNIRRVKDVIGK